MREKTDGRRKISTRNVTARVPLFALLKSKTVLPLEGLLLLNGGVVRKLITLMTGIHSCSISTIKKYSLSKTKKAQ